MGIKGIYPELGQGRRVALSRLTADSLAASGRPFRIAIDVAIWQFQAQAAKGGTNPAARTLFYRLVRLLGAPIQPVFVFDGPNKPAFKRNRRAGRGDVVSTAQAKRMIRLLGFAIHDAPGEAEADCALLQKEGIVDAVLSEDVDAIMFGCTKTLRNWSAEAKSSKTPTHVSLYDVYDMGLASLGLDREGMVLVALMSGGDYLPEGVPGCGVKVACEAARAGYGKSLCRLKASDRQAIQAWRESLMHELRTNEKGYFRTRHKALAIPDDFPNIEVLRYYTHPVVSPRSSLDAVRESLAQKRPLHLEALREFTRETFGWDFRVGAIKFIRVLGQALLVRNMCQGQVDGDGYVKQVSKRRQHSSADGTPELRLTYVPAEVVPIDLSKEAEEHISWGRDGLALNSDDEFEAVADAVDAAGEASAAPSKMFDVTKPDFAWVLEYVARKSVPRAVQEWEEAEASKAARKSATTKRAVTKATKPKKTTAGMPRETLDGFVRVSKPSTAEDAGKGTKGTAGPRRARQPGLNTLQLPPSPSPRLTSKQPSTARRIDGSSPFTPSAAKPGGRPETILISSSPVHPTTDSPPPSPSPRPRPRAGQSLARAGEGAGPVRWALAEGSSRPQELSRGRSASRRNAAAEKPAAGSSSQGTKLKQMSMDAFAFASKMDRPAAPNRGQAGPPVAEQGQGRARADEAVDDAASDASGLEPLSALVSEAQASKRRPETQAPSREPSAAASPSRRKKLVVPRASDDGFFVVVEVDEAEREARAARETKLLEGRGVRCRVARWSDVAVMDLSGD